MKFKISKDGNGSEFKEMDQLHDDSKSQKETIDKLSHSVVVKTRIVIALLVCNVILPVFTAIYRSELIAFIKHFRVLCHF